jgi:cupin fold WbuC family metalloprotein
MIHINRKIIEPLLSDASQSQRQRKNYNFHQNADERIHRMIHATNPSTYVQPHKHENPDKMESFIILIGRVLVVEFSENGEITDHIILDPKTENYGVEIPERIWHTLITLEENSLVYELKDGPWNPSDDKNFASWAPTEGDQDCTNYNQEILSKLNLL